MCIIQTAAYEYWITKLRICADLRHNNDIKARLLDGNRNPRSSPPHYCGQYIIVKSNGHKLHNCPLKLFTCEEKPLLTLISLIDYRETCTGTLANVSKNNIEWNLLLAILLIRCITHYTVTQNERLTKVKKSYECLLLTPKF